MIFYLFLDGVGFGQNDPDKNPFAKFANGFFLPLAEKEIQNNSILSKLVYLKTDASMGIKGLPQSATGQTSLWTGLNAPQLLNRHISGFPTVTLKKIIEKYSIIKIFKENGFKSSFLNCYTPGYFEMIKDKPKHLSASSLVQIAGGEHLKTLEDLRHDRGIYMDITHEILREFAKDFLMPDDELMQTRDPYEMGKRAARIGRNYDLALFEFFLTDKIGHDQNWEMAEKVIYNVERFIEGILEALDEKEDQFIVTADHGNLEDLSTGTHTKNHVPVALYGKYTHEMKDKIKALCDIVPAIYESVGIKIEFEFVNTNL